MKVCSIEDCDLKSYCRNMCRMHYSRTIRNGSPHIVKNIIKKRAPHTPETRQKLREAALTAYREGRMVTPAKSDKPFGMIGKKHSPETKAKMSESAKKRIVEKPHTIPDPTGHVVSAESRAKMSKLKIGLYIGEKSYNWTGDDVKIICGYCGMPFYKRPSAIRPTPSNPNNSGKRFCSRDCINNWKIESDFNKGANSPNWKGGNTPLYMAIRTLSQNRTWRRKILKRDNYTCVKCGATKNDDLEIILHVNHIKAFIDIIKEHSIDSLDKARKCAELWDIENGETLCIDCHKKTDTWGGRKADKICV